MTARFAVLLVVLGVIVKVGWGITKFVWAAFLPHTYDPALVYVVDVAISWATWPYAMLIAAACIIAAIFQGA